MIKNYEEALKFTNPDFIKLSESILKYLQEQFPKQLNAIAQYKVNFSDFDEKIHELMTSLKNLEVGKKAQEKRLGQIKDEIQQLNLGKRSAEKMEKREALKKERKDLMKPVYGRFKIDSLSHMIFCLKTKISYLINLRENKQGKFINVENNIQKLSNTFEDRKEAVEIAKILATSLYSILPKQYELTADQAKELVNIMTREFKMDDLKFYPFENLERSRFGEDGTPIYDLNEVNPKEIRRLLYTTLQGRVMKFGKYALNIILRENA